MKKTYISLIDTLLIPVCFVFVFSTLVKISSFTSYEHLIFNEAIWAYSSFVIFLALAAIITPHLHREILALRVPLKEWLRLHHLR